MKRLLTTLALAASFCLHAAEPIMLKLWPEGAPEPAGFKALPETRTGQQVTNVSEPTITIYKPEKPNGAAVVVAPGGGFRFLSYESEGTQVCEWLNSIGVTGVLLKYRVPKRDESMPYKEPVQDAQRAIGMVRHHASEWGIDPKRVGLLGFSGGNLLGHVIFDQGELTYPKQLVTDDNVRPDFAVMIYGGGFLDKVDKTKLREGFTIPDNAPPAFFLVAHDDKTNPIEATLLYLEYKKKNIPAELHIMTKGGHGFGMRKAGNPINDWPARCGEWMNSIGLLKATP